MSIVKPEPRTDLLDGEEGEHWTDQIAGFDSVAGQPRVLCGWVAGRAALTMESLTEWEVLQQCWAVLCRVLGPARVPPPVSCRTTRWAAQPRVRGSYSYTTPACTAAGLGPATLARPVPATGLPRLLFAGEATDCGHYGTVTGAMVAGCREAARLAALTSKPAS